MSDSSIGYDSGDENEIHFVKKNSLRASKEGENETGNPHFMNSSVAFGANDWDKFEHERGEDDLGSLSLCEDHLVQHQLPIDHVDAPTVIEKESDAKAPSRGYEVLSLQKPISEENSKEVCMKFDTGIRRKAQSVNSKEVRRFNAGEAWTKQIVDAEELTVTPLCNSIFEQSYNALSSAFVGTDTGAEEVDEVCSLPPLVVIDRGLVLETIVAKNSDSVDVAGEDLQEDEVVLSLAGETPSAVDPE